jgi:DNA-directed RNA polymerase-5 subunit 1
MPTDGKLHIAPGVQFSFSDANTILSESIEGTVKVIADSIDSRFMPNVT